MFPCLDGTVTNLERVLVTLYRAGAMSQGDLATLLQWESVRTSRIITAVNRGTGSFARVKIGEYPDKIGERHPGKIRMLTPAGMDVASALLGYTSSRAILTEGECRTATYLSRYVMNVVQEHGPINYFGPYFVPVYFSKSKKGDFPLPFGMIEQDGNYVWLEWVGDVMPRGVIEERIDLWARWRWDGIANHGVLFVAQSINVMDRLKTVLGTNPKIIDHEVVFSETYHPNLLF